MMRNFPHWKSKKRLRSAGSRSCSKDRISDLPNSIIQHILSFLPTKDAIKFCTLSRQFDSLWTSINSLSFHFESIASKDVCRFASFVDKTLMAYAFPEIKRFTLLNFNYSNDLKNQLESWLHFATSHKAEELCLQFSRQNWNWHRWQGNILPTIVRVNIYVTKMSLDLFDLYPCGGLQSFCWTSLKVLSLTKSRFNDETIRAILLGSPLLESLALLKCKLVGSFSMINATGTSLKELVVDGFRSTCCWQMNISAPRLLSLTVMGFCNWKRLNLVDVKSLTEATINLERKFYAAELFVAEEKMFKGLLQQLSHVSKFTVGISSLQVLSIIKIHLQKRPVCFGFPTSKRKIVKVDMEMKKGYLHGLVALLYSSPYLEQLTINVIPSTDFEFMAADNECFTEKYLSVWLLKSIEIKGFVAGSCSNSDELLVELAQYLLANAMRLEELIIHAEVDSLSSEPKKLMKLLEITRTLLCYPRASPGAQVVFKSGVFESSPQ